MFDQSLLPDHGEARKISAIFATFSAQIAFAGVLLLVPLLYHETLAFHMAQVLEYPSLSAAPQTPPTTSSAGTKHSSLSPRQIFRAPSRDQLESPSTSSAVVAADAPGLDFGAGGPDFAGRLNDALPQLAPPPKPETPRTSVIETTAPPAAPVRVSQGVLSAQLIRKVVPPYPALAKVARVQGTVHLMGIVGRDGTVQNLRVVSGHPLLVEAALGAVRQWLYRPTLLNGQPVDVIAPIDVIFTLQ